jgi:glycosyltransferase involved in cell wall biosynthesis
VVLNEAIASGLPIVASSGVAAADDLVVAGENGVVFPGGDVGALALCLGDLAADSERRLRLGRASRRIARDWTLAKGVERWLAFCRHGLGLET